MDTIAVPSEQDAAIEVYDDDSSGVLNSPSSQAQGSGSSLVLIHNSESEVDQRLMSRPSFTRVLIIAAAFIGGALYSASSGPFGLIRSDNKQLRSRSGWMTDSSMSTARANTVPYEAQGHLVAPSVSTHSKQNDTSIAQVMAQMQTMLTDALNRLEDVENRAERAAEAMEAATRERERLNSLPSVDQAAKAPESKVSACNDAFDAAEVAATHCRLITCDEGSSVASRTSTYVGPNCVTDTWIERHPVPLTEAEHAANAKLGDQPYDWVFYPGLEPKVQPNCVDWFMSEHQGFVGTVNQYLAEQVATTGISRRVYYNSKRAQEGRRPRMVYVYGGATVEEYQKEMTLFNLKQARKAFGDDAFIILAEATGFEGLDAYIEYVDVILHTRVVSSDVYYDDLLLQEGILEAYKIFGKDLIGVEMLVVVNDSLMGPMDLQIYEKWRAVQNQAIISMTVWRNTITTGAGMVFTRGALEHKSFSAFWSMALWEGTSHGYFTSYGASCLTSTNEVDSISWTDRWSEWKLPYYKHRNKHGDGVSIYQQYKDRTADPTQEKSITLQDRFGQSDEGVEGKGFENCDLGTRGGYPPMR